MNGQNIIQVRHSTYVVILHLVLSAITCNRTRIGNNRLPPEINKCRPGTLTRHGRHDCNGGQRQQWSKQQRQQWSKQQRSKLNPFDELTGARKLATWATWAHTTAMAGISSDSSGANRSGAMSLVIIPFRTSDTASGENTTGTRQAMTSNFYDCRKLWNKHRSV